MESCSSTILPRREHLITCLSNLTIIRWIDEVRNYAAQDITIIIVGNKKDLESNREVSLEEGQSLAEQFKCYFLETSALDNSDKMIEKVFTTLAEDIIVKKHDDEETKSLQGQKIELGNTQEKKPVEESKGCC